MIEGLMLTISGAEIKLLCEEQAARIDVAEIRERADQFKSAAEKHPAYASERARLNYLAEQMEKEVRELKFYASHLEPSERYRLGTKELIRIGVITMEKTR